MPTTVAGVTRFSVFSSLDDPADGWEAELADLALMLAPDDDVLYQLPAGLLNDLDQEVLITQIAAAKILTRRLVGTAAERRVFVRGLDAMGDLFRTQRRIRYVPAPAPQEIENDGSDPTVEVKIGHHTARSIAADLLVGTGRTLFWDVRDYALTETFDGIGSIYELLRRLVEPWDQPQPFGVDIGAQATVVHVAMRPLAPVTTDTMTVAESRLDSLTLGDRRRLPKYGLVTLEGRMEPSGGGVTFFPGDPPVTESSLVTVPFSEPVTDAIGNLLSLVEGSHTYRMPDRLLTGSVTRIHQKQASGFVVQVSEETITNTFEASRYGPAGPINQPLPISAMKSLLTRVPNPIPAPGTTGTMTLAETQREEVAWRYDERRFLTAKTTVKRKRTEVSGSSSSSVDLILGDVLFSAPTPGSAVVYFPETERLTERYRDLLSGWVQLTVTRTTISTAGVPTSTVKVTESDAAGFRPGGIRQPFGFEHAGIIDAGGAGTLTPITLSDTISEDDDAIPVHYANRNLTAEDLAYLMARYAAASGLVEYPVIGSGPAMPFLLRGAVLKLDDFFAPDGVTAIPLDAAQIRKVTLDYEDSTRRQEFRGDFEAVFYRAS